MALSPEERSELIASVTAQDALDRARRRGCEDTYLVGAGLVTVDKLQRNIATLMSALADDQCWMLADDPLTWRYVMIDVLWKEVERFVLCVEGPTFDLDDGFMVPNP